MALADWVVAGPNMGAAVVLSWPCAPLPAVQPHTSSTCRGVTNAVRPVSITPSAALHAAGQQAAGEGKGQQLANGTRTERQQAAAAAHSPLGMQLQATGCRRAAAGQGQQQGQTGLSGAPHHMHASVCCQSAGCRAASTPQQVPLLAASTVVLQLDMSCLRMLFCRMLSRAEQVELAETAGRGGQREQLWVSAVCCAACQRQLGGAPAGATNTWGDDCARSSCPSQ